jgi:hypothetical protein
MKPIKRLRDLPGDGVTWSVQDYLDYLNDYIIDYWTNKSNVYRPVALEASLLKDIVIGTDVTGMVFDFSNVTYESMTANSLKGCNFVFYRPTQIPASSGFIAPMICAFARNASRPTHIEDVGTFYIGGSYGEYRSLDAYNQVFIGNGAIPVFTIDTFSQTLTWHDQFVVNKTYTITTLPYMPEETDFEMAGGSYSSYAYPISLGVEASSGISVDCEYLYGQDAVITTALNEIETYIEELGEKKSNIYEMASTITVPELQNGFDILNTIIDFSAITKDVIRDAVRSPNAVNGFYALRPSNTINYKDCYLTFYSPGEGSVPEDRDWDLYAGGTIYEDASNPYRIPQDGVKIFGYNGFWDILTWEPDFVDNKTFQFTASLTGFDTNHKFDSIESPEGLVNIFAKLITVASGDGTLDIDCQFLSNQIASLTNTVGNIDANLSNMIYGIKADQPWYKINDVSELTAIDNTAQHMPGTLGYFKQSNIYCAYGMITNPLGHSFTAYPIFGTTYSVALYFTPYNNFFNYFISPVQDMPDASQGAIVANLGSDPSLSGKYVWVIFMPAVNHMVDIPGNLKSRIIALEAKLPDLPDGAQANTPYVLTGKDETNE